MMVDKVGPMFGDDFASRRRSMAKAKRRSWAAAVSHSAEVLMAACKPPAKRKIWATFAAVCRICDYRWPAVVPIRGITDRLKCPRCGRETGEPNDLNDRRKVADDDDDDEASFN